MKWPSSFFLETTLFCWAYFCCCRWKSFNTSFFSSSSFTGSSSSDGFVFFASSLSPSFPWSWRFRDRISCLMELSFCCSVFFLSSSESISWSSWWSCSFSCWSAFDVAFLVRAEPCFNFDWILSSWAEFASEETGADDEGELSSLN